MNIRKVTAPPIKCQGIKTRLAPWIAGTVPSDFNGAWIEPFMGSGAVAFNILPKRAMLADSNPHVVNFYQAVAHGTVSSRSVRSHLIAEGEKLLRSGGEHYYRVRERFNIASNPLDFLFLNRACFNGLMRFNRQGQFNVPFCRKPGRFSPAYVTKIANQVAKVEKALKLGCYEFVCAEFQDTIRTAAKDDMIYADPPYINRHSDYFGIWSEGQDRQLATALASAPCRFILSTWHSNQFRRNNHIDTLWGNYFISTRKHFYHLGAKEENRNPMIEALVTNFKPRSTLAQPTRQSTGRQITIFESSAGMVASEG